jgi:hypothetical protein
MTSRALDEPQGAALPERSTSRRAVLAAAAGAAAAFVARGVLEPESVNAADDGTAIVIGGTYADAVGQTTVANDNNANRVIWIASNADGAGAHGDGVAITGFSAKNIGVEGWSGTGEGVYGHSTSNYGVHGQSGSGYGVLGQATTGRAVAGFSDGNYGVMGLSSSAIGHAGVFGQGNGGPGVEGHSGATTGVMGYAGGLVPSRKTKTGVHGFCGSDNASVGVWGEAVTGYAFRGSGRVRFDKVTGVASIAKGATSKTINPGVDVTSRSFVLLTPKANIGGRSLWFTTNATSNTFTIRMSAARSSATKVGWLLLG